MTSPFFPMIQRWRIPALFFQQSLAEMAGDGAHGNEGVALWLGRREGPVAYLTQVVGVRGLDVMRLPDHLSLPATEVNAVADIAIRLGLSLLGQVHSHGPQHGVDLSWVDRAHGISVPWFLSVVVPDYAQRSTTSLFDCGVHVFELGSGFRRFEADELTARVEVTADKVPPIILVGEEVGT